MALIFKLSLESLTIIQCAGQRFRKYVEGVKSPRKLMWVYLSPVLPFVTEDRFGPSWELLLCKNIAEIWVPAMGNTSISTQITNIIAYIKWGISITKMKTIPVLGFFKKHMKTIPVDAGCISMSWMNELSKVSSVPAIFFSGWDRSMAWWCSQWWSITVNSVLTGQKMSQMSPHMCLSEVDIISICGEEKFSFWDWVARSSNPLFYR